MIYIVGSGPVGISCAYALLKKGISVTMLDVGTTLESNKKKIVHILKDENKENWDKKLLQEVKKKMSVSASGLPKKLLFGSDFAYRGVAENLKIYTSQVDWSGSFSRGGLSNVWGAAILPYRQNDINDWPISLADLEPFYKHIFQFMNLSARKDSLEEIFPLYTNKQQNLCHSRQASILLRHLENEKTYLNEQRIFFGSSRLAVCADVNKNLSGCCYCGLCLYGCPYNLIFNADNVLSMLLKQNGFIYINEVIVEKVEENGNIVKIYGKKNDKNICFEADRVFLACGAIPTSKILLQSLHEYDHEIKMKYSQYFLLPLISYDSAKLVEKEELHTLSQVFLEILDPIISSNTIHLQLYTYNDLYSNAIKQRAGIFYPFIKKISKNIISRLFIVQGYIHSLQSPEIGISLDASGKLNLEAKHNKETKKVVTKILRKLAKNSKKLRFYPLTPFLKIGQVGSGYHYGGTFPMSKEPNKLQTDIFGRPFGLKRVHAIDASIFPSIPSTTITFTAMANAYRIASTFGEIEQ